MSMMLPHRKHLQKCRWLPRRLIEAFFQYGWSDVTWGADDCANFCYVDGDRRYTAWCDAKDRRHRLTPAGGRYVVNDQALHVTIAEFDQTDILVQWLETCFPRSTETPTVQ